MKKFVFLLLAGIAVSCMDPAPAFVSNHDWSEPAGPDKGNPFIWDTVQGARASFANIDVRYPRSLPFGGEVARQASVTGWRGEKLSVQLVVWSTQEIRDLKCDIGAFKAAGGTRLEGIGRARFVKYVLSDRFLPHQACGRRPADNPAHLEPDLLSEEPSVNMAARTTRPVWLTVEIPRDAPAGTYTADIRLRGKGFSQKLTLTLHVVGRTLPAPAEWAYHLDLWQHPSAVARVEGLDMWSDAHFEAMKPVMKLLAAAGQKVITATLNKEPWNNQCYDAYADMIVWTRHADGSWEYDFSVFDRWVEMMLELGVTGMINCYSMLPWNNLLHYRDGETGRFVEVKADPGTPEFRMMWAPFLPAFENHLHEKGWLGITQIAMDERSPEQMAEATSLLAEAAPRLGIALADNHKIFKKYPYIKDMCTSIFDPIDLADIRDRRAGGLVTTYYVCCSSGFPNTYTSSDPAEAAYLAWHAAAHDYDGFLRWSYNSWTEDPIRDSRFRTWTAGDTYIVYPEGNSSIRFERLIEGIQDFEKVRLLRREFAGDTARQALLDELLLPFRTNKRVEGWNETLNEAKRVLNGL